MNVIVVGGDTNTVIVQQEPPKQVVVQAPGPSMLVGALRWDIAQTLTSPQQAQARSNIGFAAAVIATALTGFTAAAGGTITSADTVLSAFGKVEYRLADLEDGALTGPLTITANSSSAALTLVNNGAGLALTTTGGITAGAFTGPLTGNVTGNVSGSAGSVAAANLTGTTLAAGVTASSLTSLGTLSSLAVGGAQTITLNSASAGLTITQSGAGAALSTNGQIVSTLATGTAPFSVASTTNVANLNASSLSGATFAAPGTIGGGTPGAANFTTLNASSLVRISVADSATPVFGISGTTKGVRVITTISGTAIDGVDNTLTTSFQPLFLRGSTVSLSSGGTAIVDVSSVGALVTGLMTVTGQTSLGGAVGAEALRALVTASAVNRFEFAGSATGGYIGFAAAGSDTNIGVTYTAKATGTHDFYARSGSNFRVGALVNSAVNFFTVSGQVTGTGPLLNAGGPDANVSARYRTQGTGQHQFETGASGNLGLVVAHTASAVNHASVTGSATGLSVVYGAGGSDTNVPTVVTSKGASPVGIYTNTGTVTAAFFQHVASAVNRMDFYPSAAGGAVAVNPEGSDTNISYHVSTKGSGLFRVFTGSYASEGLRVTHVASTVNYFNVFGAATTGSVYVGTGGSDANAGVVLYSKGSGTVGIYTNSAGNPVALFAHTASTANFWQFYGSAAGGALAMYAGGSDANIGIVHTAKGTGNIAMYGNGGSTILFRASGVASSVNYINVFPSATGGGPTIYASGTDANINCNHSLQGSGSHIFYTGSTSVIQFSVSHTASAVNRLEITGSATGNAIAISTAGSDANRSITFTTAGTGTVRFSNKIYPGTPAAATQTAAGISGGTGAPSNADASDGDFYFRSDGGALTSIYHKRAGAWVGIV